MADCSYKRRNVWEDAITLQKKRCINFFTVSSQWTRILLVQGGYMGPGQGDTLSFNVQINGGKREETAMKGEINSFNILMYKLYNLYKHCSISVIWYRHVTCHPAGMLGMASDRHATHCSVCCSRVLLLTLALGLPSLQTCECFGVPYCPDALLPTCRWVCTGKLTGQAVPCWAGSLHASCSESSAGYTQCQTAFQLGRLELALDHALGSTGFSKSLLW